MPLLGAGPEQTSFDNGEMMMPSSSLRPLSPNQVPIDMLPSSERSHYLSPRVSTSGNHKQGVKLDGLKPLPTKKPPKSPGGIELEDTRRDESPTDPRPEGASNHAAPLSPSARGEELVDLSAEAAGPSGDYHHNLAQTGAIAAPAAAELEAVLKKIGSTSVSAALTTGAPARLSLNVRGLTDVDVVSIASYLRAPGRLSALTVLSLSNNAIADLGARALAQALLSNGGAPLLTKLALHENALGDVGMGAIASVMAPEGAPALQELRLGFNRIGDPGALAFARAMARGGAAELRELHLAANNVGDAGAAAIAGALHSAPRLKTLVFGTSLGGNAIREEGALALAKGLRSNGGRAFALSLRSNILSEAATDELRSTMDDCGRDLVHIQYDPGHKHETAQSAPPTQEASRNESASEAAERPSTAAERRFSSTRPRPATSAGDPRSSFSIRAQEDARFSQGVVEVTSVI